MVRPNQSINIFNYQEPCQSVQIMYRNNLYIVMEPGKRGRNKKAKYITADVVITLLTIQLPFKVFVIF